MPKWGNKKHRGFSPGGNVVQLSTPTANAVWIELWVSLASLLRSYTAAHGLNGNCQATVELGEEKITVRHADQWLELIRSGATVDWKREDGRSGTMELTESGKLREGTNEEEMDIVAEAWARELMQ